MRLSKEAKKNDRNNTRSGRDASNDRERRTDGDSIGVDRMNMETLQEAYRQLQRDYIDAQNKLQDIGFVLADAAQYPADRSPAGMYIKEIVKIWERD